MVEADCWQIFFFSLPLSTLPLKCLSNSPPISPNSIGQRSAPMWVFGPIRSLWCRTKWGQLQSWRIYLLNWAPWWLGGGSGNCLPGVLESKGNVLLRLGEGRKKASRSGWNDRVTVFTMSSEETATLYTQEHTLTSGLGGYFQNGHRQSY